MNKNDKLKLIIFDFDGTIADSFSLCFESVNEILKESGRDGVTEREKQAARNLSAREVFLYFKIRNYQLPFVLRKIFSVMKKKFNKVKIFPGMKNVLRALKNKDLKVILLTSNIKKSVKMFLEKEGTVNCFEDLYFRSEIFSKHILINRMLRKYQLKNNQVILIGDEVRDIEASKKSGIIAIAVDWGFNSKEVLFEGNPDYLINKPSEILGIINNNLK